MANNSFDQINEIGNTKKDNMNSISPRVAIILPCYNEEITIAKVIQDFSIALPEAEIYVFDNNSTDRTREKALNAGAKVSFVASQGKGWTVRSMFRDVDADLYIMADGDDTYPADKVRELLVPVYEGKADMVVGTRLHDYHDHAFRNLHKFGNNLVLRIINMLFGANLSDVLSGYRVFSRRFVKTMPVLSKGFEIETELTLHALENGFPIKEISIPYGKRPDGSFSKLNTFSDGLRVLKTILWLFKDYRPLIFFSFIGGIFLFLGILFGGFVVSEYIATEKVTHPSTAVLATALCTLGALFVTIGLILDTVNRRGREQYVLLVDHLIDAQNRKNI